MVVIEKIYKVFLLVVVIILSASCFTVAQELSRNESNPFPLRPSLAAKQLQGVSGSETCSLPEARTAIGQMFRQLSMEEVEDEFICDNAVLGKFRYCPAPNCSQTFSTSQIFRFPGYYWITAENGSTIQMYCDFESEQFSYTTTEIEDIAENICLTTEQREFVQDSIQLHDQLSQISPSLLTCTFQIIGLVAHCPANSCSQALDIVPEEFLRLSNYYWLQAPDGHVTEVYCNRNTMQPEYSSCQQLFEFETAPSGNYTIHLSDGTNLHAYCNNETGEMEYVSCAHANLNALPSGIYTIHNSQGNPVTVYCDMDNEECGGGVWTRIASYNYSDPNTTCPGDWNLITSPIRACGRNLSPSGGNCHSALFPTNDIAFSSICGRVIAIQYGAVFAFYPFHRENRRTIDESYVVGVSITYGNPRQHVWTFAGYPNDGQFNTDILCSCSNPSLGVPSIPPFVGNDYFCDTAAQYCCANVYYPDDPLWDGQGCDDPSTCCSFNNPPWFSTELPNYTSDDIEVRICDDDSSPPRHTPITLLDLYIQ